MLIKSGISVDGQLIPNATGSLGTVPNGERRVINSAVAYANIAGSTLNLFIVPNGGSATDSNKVIQRSMALDESYIVSELIGQGIEAGGSLSGNDGGVGGTDVNITYTYTKFTGESV